MCLDASSMCNMWVECPNGDDEHLCLQRVPDCPNNCVCSFFSVSCTGCIRPGIHIGKQINFIHVTVLDQNTFDLQDSQIISDFTTKRVLKPTNPGFKS